MISAPQISAARTSLSSRSAHWQTRALGPASLLALALACACSGSPNEIAGGGTGGQRDGGAQSGNGDGDAFGDGDGDGDDGTAGDGDSCAWADARPVAKSPVVWLAFDQDMLRAPYRRADGTEEGTNGDALRAVLFGTNGIVSRLQHFVRFGFTAYGVTAAFNCEVGTVIPAALDNAAAIAAEYDASIKNTQLSGDANWASLEAIATEIAKQQGLFRHAVLLLTEATNTSLCPNEGFADSAPHVRAAVEALAAKGTVVSVVTFLYPGDKEFNQKAIERDAALAKTGGGQAFAGTDGEALIASVQRFVEEGVSCEVSLEGKVKDGEECSGDVQLGDQKLACNDVDGFKLKDPSTLELTGKACDDLRSESGLVIRARFPCQSFVLY